ncbi:MAG TPA: hypothetical protein VKU77_38980 [Streptosporangiaceae bacterium]|nr:hypothetical protein [Streptosporangiaceae bacterium]
MAVYYTALLVNVAWRAVIAAEPALAVELSPDQLDRALAAIANFVDLKSPFTLGHPVAVAELAEDAARRLGLPRRRRDVRRAARSASRGEGGHACPVVTRRR